MISKIDVLREKGTMSILWTDETRQELELDDLRRLCPCAVCESNRMAQDSNGLQMISSDAQNASSGVAEITPVGRYAIQIRWEDGHDTGIYTYEFLRSLGEVSS